MLAPIKYTCRTQTHKLRTQLVLHLAALSASNSFVSTGKRVCLSPVAPPPIAGALVS